MSKKQKLENADYLIRFNEVDREGNMYLPGSINIEQLDNLKLKGEIKDYEIDDKGVKIIKDFKIDSASL